MSLVRGRPARYFIVPTIIALVAILALAALATWRFTTSRDQAQWNYFVKSSFSAQIDAVDSLRNADWVIAALPEDSPAIEEITAQMDLIRADIDAITPMNAYLIPSGSQSEQQEVSPLDLWATGADATADAVVLTPTNSLEIMANFKPVLSSLKENVSALTTTLNALPLPTN